jgi:predicted acyl esterase
MNRGDHTSGAMTIDWDVPIVMEDGITLRADVFRPSDPGRYPVILAYGPYGKGLAFEEGFEGRWQALISQHPEVARDSSCRFANFEMVDPEKWVPDGYVCVRVDSRGAGRSEGLLCPFQPRETKDLYECIEWAAEQSWSTGKIGLSGISYLAINQWHVAAMQPPHLTAMIPWEGAADWYRDCTHHGGILTTFWDLLFNTIITRVQHGVGDAGFKNSVTGDTVAGPETVTVEELRRNRCDLGEQIRERPMWSDYYRDRSPDWSRINVPFLSAGNWGGQGLHLRGNVEAFVNAASTEKWLEVHGLEHWTHYYTDYGLPLQKQFFEYYLKGIDNGWKQRPPLILQVRHVDKFESRTEDEWPLVRTQWTRLYLNTSNMSLSAAAPEDPGQVSYEGFGAGVTFLSEPMQEVTEITGPSAARLHISSSTSDADLFLVLQVFDPEGKEVVFSGAQHPHTPVSQGWLRCSHRQVDPERSAEYRPFHTHDNLQPLTPGTVYPVAVEIWPTSVVVPIGYRVALSVRGTDYDYQETADSGRSLMVASTGKQQRRGPGAFLHDDPHDRPADIFGGNVVLHSGGEMDSYVLLPVVPPKEPKS